MKTDLAIHCSIGINRILINRIPSSQIKRRKLVLLIFIISGIFSLGWFQIIHHQWTIYNTYMKSVPSFDFLHPPIFNATRSVLSSNLLLWSQQPDSSNWTQLENMCHSILSPNPNETEYYKAGKYLSISSPHDDTSMANLLSNCTEFRKLVQFQTRPLSPEESDFALAYVFVAARNAGQTVRLFRMLYQPQNAYCLTYDNKSSEDYKSIVKQLAKCFRKEANVFLTPAPEEITYARFPLLHSEMVCLKLLLEKWSLIKWKYVQIVSWNDFALKSNFEMVQIFKILNQSQDTALDPTLPRFFVTQTQSIPPDGLTIYKGSHATSMTKDFIEFIFTNPTSLKLYKWMEPVECPEEQYWQTLIYNTHLNAPGSFPGECHHYYDQSTTAKPYISRYQSWEIEGTPCEGKMVHMSCVFGLLDVPYLIKRPELMAHKLYEEFEPAATFCLEMWYWKKVYDESTGLNISYYQNLPSVRYQNLEDKNNFQC